MHSNAFATDDWRLSRKDWCSTVKTLDLSNRFIQRCPRQMKIIQNQKHIKLSWENVCQYPGKNRKTEKPSTSKCPRDLWTNRRKPPQQLQLFDRHPYLQKTNNKAIKWISGRKKVNSMFQITIVCFSASWLGSSTTLQTELVRMNWCVLC